MADFQWLLTRTVFLGGHSVVPTVWSMPVDATLAYCQVQGSGQLSHSVVSDSLWPHGLQHARPPCPSPTPGACSNSCALSRWCHPTISSSVISFSSCLQSFPASGSFPMSHFFCIRWPKYWSFNISPSSEYSGLIPLGWTGWSCSPRDSQESSPTPQFKSINSLAPSFLYSSTLTSIHDYWKNHSLD